MRRPLQPLACAGAFAIACTATDPEPAVSSTSTTGATSSTAAQADSTTTEPVAQAPICADWLVCLAEIAPDELADAQAQYGPEGSCWVDAELASQCAEACNTEIGARCSAGSSGDSGDPPLKCSIEGLAPGAPDPIDGGDGVGQIPSVIADVLARNCGCHYVDAAELDRTVPAYQGTIGLATLADFHAPFMGVPTYQRVQQRAVVELSMPPPFYCDPMALGSLSIDDHAALETWLAADAPDGASWPD